MEDIRARSRAEAERLLERMFKAGAQHLYIFERMQALPQTRHVLSGPPAVNVELLLILLALVREVSGASAKTCHKKAAAKAQTLIPGLKGWNGPRSDWLGSGVERVPLNLIPLLLHRKALWVDDSLAEALKGCRAWHGSCLLSYHRPVIQGFIAHVDSWSKRNGLGRAATDELQKLVSKLVAFTKTENSSLATWAKKQVSRLQNVLKRES